MTDAVTEIENVLGKGWVQSLADSIAGRSENWRFRSQAGEKCSRCGEEWGNCNNYPGMVYHLCKVPQYVPDGKGVKHGS